MTNEPANGTNTFDVQRYLEGDKKFQLKPVHNKDYFLPALACFIELFGTSPSVRTLIKSAEKQLQVQSGISNSSLDNFSRQGVGKKTAEKFFSFLFNLNPKLFKLIEPLGNAKDTIYENDNYWPWLGVVSSLQDFEKEEETELVLCVAFLAERCQQSKQINDTFRAIKKTEPDTLKVLKMYFDQATKHTLLNDEESAAFMEGIVVEINKPGSDVTEKVILAALRYRLDFYFNLMATLEVGILRLWLEIDADVQNRVPDFYQNGLFCSITDIHNQSSPFSRFLDDLKERFNPYVLKGSSPISDYKFATFIPISKGDEQCVTLHEAQKRQLRKWREGSAYPSLDTLEDMISNLFGFKEQIPVIAKCLANIGYFCIGLDRLHKQLLENKDVSAELLNEAYGSYPRYWQQYRQHIWQKS